MAVESGVAEGISLFSDASCKLNFVGPNDVFALHHDNAIKTEEANLVAQAVAHSLSQMVTLTPDQSAFSASGLPLGTVLSMASPNPTSRDQVFITMQHVGGVNGNGTNFLDLMDDGKAADLSHSMNQVSSPTLSNVNGVTQLVSGNFQTVVNLQGLQGFDGLPQLTSMSVPAGLPGFNQNAALPTRSASYATNGSIPQAMEMTYHSVPQTVNVPQFVLSNSQLMQNVHGVNQLNQLVIPSSSIPSVQGGTQQILMIPIQQMAPSNPGAQMVQLMTPNGQVITTSLAGLQALTNQPTMNVVPQQQQQQQQQQPVLNSGVQGLSLPQIVTNSLGQILAVSPQLIGQTPGLVQVYGSNGQLHLDKQPQQQQQQQQQQHMLQTGGYLTKPLQTTAANGPSTMIPSQAAHIQISTVGDTTQVANQAVVTQRSVTTPTQVVQVAQTSSPSITSTESSTPISQTSANTVDGINLEEIKDFAKAFKIRRLSLGLTQTQVGQALSVTEGPAYSQSAICRFEKLDITPKSAQRIKPVLEHWMREAEERYKNGSQNLTDFIGTEPSKKRKRRTSFTPQALEVLGFHFDRNTHPTGAEMTELAGKLNYEREVVRVWFCNKRQTLKNTVTKKLKSVNQ